MAEQKLLLGNVRGPQGPAGPNSVSGSTTTSGFENGHVLFNNNGKVGAKKLSASDVGAEAALTLKSLSPSLGQTVLESYSSAHQYGKIVFVKIAMELSSKPGASSRDTVLMKGLPANAASGYGMVYEQSTGLAHLVQINETGELKLIVNEKGFTSAQPYLWGSITYVAK